MWRVADVQLSKMQAIPITLPPIHPNPSDIINVSYLGRVVLTAAAAAGCAYQRPVNIDLRLLCAH